MERCVDPRGADYVSDVLWEISKTLGCDSIEETCVLIDQFFNDMSLGIPTFNDKQMEELVEEVNVERLKNHPVLLEKIDIYELYSQILKGENKG